MYTIFRKARSVIGWLGHSTYEYCSLLNCLSAFRTMGLGRGFGNHNACAPQATECKDSREQMISNAVHFIYANQWFKRTWIHQEVSAARQMKMLCGSYEFDMHDLHNIVRDVHLLRTEAIPRSFFILTYSINRGLEPFEERNRPQSPWLHLVLQNIAEFEVTLPQDRIFALQNIVEPELVSQDRLLPVVDYSMSSAEVFGDFVKRLINKRANLDPLNIFQDRSSCDLTLPSWTIDFSVSRPRLVSYTFSNRLIWDDGSIDIDLTPVNVLRLYGLKMATLTTDREIHPHEFEGSGMNFDYWSEGYGKPIWLPTNKYSEHG